MKLEDWWLDREDDPFRAPEDRRPFLCGMAYGHPKFTDGVRVKTGVIRKVEGRRITTGDESDVWELGEINADYKRWMEENGFVHDPKNPIKVKSNPRLDHGEFTSCVVPRCRLPRGHKGDHKP